MSNGTTPTEPRRENEPRPQQPFENDESIGPEKEMNPGEIATETEVDLDKQKIPTYPKTTPPEEH
ncbi:MAG TPA: hypothetical protein VKZ84_02915 [Bacteriovoracaceae bacterium]|nr:hypothetical protein [Bacteriovoracaceae bacterium]